MAEPAVPLAAGAARRARGMPAGLLDLYLVRGVAGSFLTILVGVGLVMMLERALRLIHLLAASGADIGFFFPLMAQLVPYYLNLALPAAFMVALVLLIARLDDNLELEAMLASGVSLARIAAPLVGFGIAIALASLVVVGWLEPLGRHGFNSMKAAAVNSGRIGRLQPRAFYHPAENFALTFDRRGGDGRVGGVFVWQRIDDGSVLVLTGAEARIGFAPAGRRFAVRLSGGRYVAERPGAAPMTFAFRTLNLRESLLLEESGWERGWSQKELTLSELAAGIGHPHPRISEAAFRTEIYSRLAKAASIPLIPLLVLPLAFATKNGRRGLGILLGGIFLAGFHHAINFARQPALAGTAAPEAAIWGTTAAGAALVLLIFWSGRHLPSRSPIASALAPLGDALARLRPRAARLRSIRGRTLATYLAWRLAKWALIAALAMVLLLQTVDIVERSDEFAQRNMGLADVAHYAWLRLPPMILQAIPMAALASAMTVFVALSRSQEMVAIRGAGISQYRVLAMALPVPLLLAFSSYFLAEQAVPASQARLAAWWSQSEPAPAWPDARARWFRIGNEIVRAGAASPDGARLERVDIFRRDRRGLLIERVSAASAAQADGRWLLSGVERTRFEENRARRDQAAHLPWATPLRAEDAAMFFSAAPSLSAAAAQRSLDEAAPVSRSAALFVTCLHRSWAEPLAPFIMLLLALPLAFVSPRTGVAWPALLYAGGGGLLYLATDGVLTVAAQVGAIPPVVGAWTAPVLFALGGLTILLYSER